MYVDPVARHSGFQLLAVLKDPHPTLSSLEIGGDPRLQRGERVRVVDAEGVALDADLSITATAPPALRIRGAVAVGRAEAGVTRVLQATGIASRALLLDGKPRHEIAVVDLEEHLVPPLPGGRTVRSIYIDGQAQYDITLIADGREVVRIGPQNPQLEADYAAVDKIRAGPARGSTISAGGARGQGQG